MLERINGLVRRRKLSLMSFGEMEVLNLIDSIAMIGASLIPFYLSYATKITPLRVLSFLLGLFAFSHGLYHFLFAFVFGYSARAVLDSFSVGVLLTFLVYFAKKGGLP